MSGPWEVDRNCCGLSGSWAVAESAISVWGVLASCEGWQTAALNLHKRTLPRLQGLVGAAGKVHRGLSGAWELQGSVWRVLASFEAWQTAALNLHKRTLPRLQGLVELQERFTAA